MVRANELVEPQIVSHWPVAEHEASRTYTELEACTYANKAIGNQRWFDEEDAVLCDCLPPDEPDELACDEDSNCTNRMMQIECEIGACRCGDGELKCANQRFQRREYAPVEVVWADKKGFGVRAKANIAADTFIYEYIGEVIGPSVFQRRMKEYGDEGIRHFYFMALDKDVFIDATRKGAKARFLNHSCRPNCHVSKWTVGRKMRMGIFARRDIVKGEELTFNYNVDRYGHDAQECLCGEPNCVGFIGGKTQTELGGMDDLYLEALGIMDEVEAGGLKGSRKRKGLKLDEDFVPVLTPIKMHEAPKVAAAIRQAISTKHILEKLLERITMTDDDAVQAQLLRLHGFNLMNAVLKEYEHDAPVVLLALRSLARWPLKARNKVESSKIEEPVSRCAAQDDNDEMRQIAQGLLDSWSELEMGYRIPRALAQANGVSEIDMKRPAEFSLESIAKRARVDSDDEKRVATRQSDFVVPEASKVRLNKRDALLPSVPDGWRAHLDDQSGKFYFEELKTRKVQWEKPREPAASATPPPNAAPAKPVPVNVNDILAQAQAEAEERARKEQDERDKLEREKQRRRDEALARRKEKLERRAAKKARAKDVKVMSLFSSIVIGVMSKYKAHLDADQFKRRAREVTQLLCDKEKKHPNYAKEAYDKLSAEKSAKVKGFVKDWMKKLLERKGVSLASIKAASSSSSSASSSSSKLTGTPSSSIATPATPATSVATKEDMDLVAEMVAGVNGSQNGHGGAGAGADDDEDMDDDDDDDADLEWADAPNGARTPTAPPPPPPPPPLPAASAPSSPAKTFTAPPPPPPPQPMTNDEDDVKPAAQQAPLSVVDSNGA